MAERWSALFVDPQHRTRYVFEIEPAAGTDGWFLVSLYQHPSPGALYQLQYPSVAAAKAQARPMLSVVLSIELGLIPDLAWHLPSGN